MSTRLVTLLAAVPGVVRSSRRVLRLRAWLVTAAAAAAAWAVADALTAAAAPTFAVPNIVAAITAVLVVRISFHRASSEAWAQLLATGLGAAMALAAVHLGLPTWASAGLVVFASLVCVRLLRLGEEAGIGVPVTALIVLGPGIQTHTAADRFSATVLGAGIAVAFSYFTHPDTPAGRAVDGVGELSDDVSSLLAQMASAAVDGFDTPQALDWLERARQMNDRVPALRASCEDAVAYARWFPRASRAEAAAVYARFIAVEHTVVTVRALARSLVEVAERGVDLPERTRDAMAGAIDAAATATAAAGGTLQESVDLAVAQVASLEDTGVLTVLTGPVTDPVAASVDELGRSASRLADHAGELMADDEAEAAAMTASVAVALRRIADSLAMESEAVTSITPSPEPAPAVQAASRVGRGLAGGASLPARMLARLRRR